MKKCLCFLLIAVLLAGCGAKPPAETGGTAGSAPTTVSTEPTVAPAPTEPTAPTEPPQLHTVWVWTQQTISGNQGSGGVYTRSYDKKGNLLTDAYASNDGKAGYQEAYTYDEQGRMLTHASYDSHSATGKSEFIYNDAGLLVTELFTNNEGYSAKTDYTYGSYGELVEKVTVSGKTEDRTVYTYDEMGHLIKEEQTLRTGEKETKPLRLEYTYDQNGNRLSKSEFRMDTLHRKEEWTYNQANQPITFRYTDGKGTVMEEAKYLYFPDGKLDQETYYEGKSAVSAIYYIYDDAGRVVKKASGTPYEKFIDVRQNVLYTYDEHGNLLTEVTAKKDGTELSRREYTYISMEVPVK